MKKIVTKKPISKVKPVKKVTPVKKDHKKGVEEIFADGNFSCNCSSCPRKCC